MPYKVMIVDDEPIIRFGLSSCVNWDQEGLSLVGEAANGEVALAMIKDEAIDILVTDIRMPIMDGLELTRQVKELLPNVKVILVSSYSDFEFAREAVKLDVVVDYILKATMEPNDLIRILQNCKRRLDEDELHHQNEQQFEHEEYRHRLMDFESKLKSYLGGNSVNMDWKPDWLDNALVIAVWKYDVSGAQSELPTFVLLESVKEQLNTWCAQGISFVSGHDEIVTLLMDHKGSANRDIRTYHQHIINNNGPSFTLGISPSVHSLKSLRDALEWATSALDQSFFEGKGECYLGQIPTYKDDHLKEEKAELQRQQKILRGKFSRSFASSDRELCMEIFELYVLEWKRQPYKREDIILEARNLLIVIGAHHFNHRSEEAMQRMMDKLTTIVNSPTLEELVSYVRKELRRLSEPDQLVITTDDVGGTHKIKLALTYIQDNYRQEISLQEVADYLHMSKNYFSEQFKKRTGYNFIDFVIRLRIHYAKHLLETTGLRILEVGLQSGFNSPKHFLKLFKRMVHATPGEYRVQQVNKQNDKSDMGKDEFL